MACTAVPAFAVGNKAVSARFGLQHVGEVFAAQRGLLFQHALWAHDALHHLACKGRFGGAVDGGRVVAHKLKVALRGKRPRLAPSAFLTCSIRSAPCLSPPTPWRCPSPCKAPSRCRMWAFATAAAR